MKKKKKKRDQYLHNVPSVNAEMIRSSAGFGPSLLLLCFPFAATSFGSRWGPLHLQAITTSEVKKYRSGRRILLLHHDWQICMEMVVGEKVFSMEVGGGRN